MAEHDTQTQVESLMDEISRLENRDLQLWYVNLAILLAVAGGFLALVFPSVIWNLGQLRLQGQYLPQLVFGLAPLIVLFNVYVVQQRQILRRAREVVTRQLLRAETAETLSLIDPLTEVFNRRYLDRIISQEVSRCDRRGSSLTFLMIDLDGFKSVNTRFGHAVGDRVLREVAELLKATFRTSDTVIRYGGDEFVVILPDTNEEQARQSINRLLKHVERWNRDSPIVGYQMSLSCGPATYSKGVNPQELLESADQRMYREKAQKPAAHLQS